MRLLFVSNLFPSSTEPHRATYNLNLARGLRSIGHDIDIVAPLAWFPFLDGIIRKRKAPPRQEILDDFHVYHPRYPYTPGLLVHKHFLFYRRAVEKTVRELASKKPYDCVILGFIYPDAVAMAPIFDDLNIPWCIRVNGSDFRVRLTQPRFAPLVQSVLQSAGKIICPGQALRDDMIAAGVSPSKISAFRNGIDKKIFFTKTRKPEERVLFVGNLVSVKAPQRVITAFQKLSRKLEFLSLDVVGEGPLRPQLEKMAQSLGLRSQVTFHGQKNPNQVAELMRKAACLILSSHSEGMPNVVLEALACGTPVVATDVGEVPHIIDDDVNGFTVNHQLDEDKLVATLSSTLEKVFSRCWLPEQVSATVATCTWRAAAEIVTKTLKEL